MHPKRLLLPGLFDGELAGNLYAGQVGGRFSVRPGRQRTEPFGEPLVLELAVDRPREVVQDFEHLLPVADREAAVVVGAAVRDLDGRADEVVLEEVVDAAQRVGAEDRVGLEHEHVFGRRQVLPEPGRGVERGDRFVRGEVETGGKEA